MKKILIVGGVAGGATAAARLRRLSEEDQIILFERDEYISFANCGLPYYIGNVIKERGKLLVQTIPGMKKRFNLDIRNFSEVIKIDKENKSVMVKNVKTNETYEESYDRLILSPGANAINLPIPGIEEAENVFTLRNIPDTDKIKSFVDDLAPKHTVVVGGGFIGIEMAENLVERGVSVTLIDLANQVMAPLDFEMAQIVHERLVNHGVNLILEDAIDEIKDKGRTLILKSGKTLHTDLVVMGIGVKPENELAKSSGLKIGKRGHIVTTKQLQVMVEKTDEVISDIYAIGDAIEVYDYIDQSKTAIALAWPANRQGRLVADHINGFDIEYTGSLGTAVAKIFDLTVATTGNNEKQLKRKQLDYKTVIVHRGNHAGYYPGAENIAIKLLFDPKNGKILGAQAVGGEGTEKRIDVIATAIKGKLSVNDLPDLELSYAPPFSSAKDPVNIAGYVASNVYSHVYDMVTYDEIDEIVKNGGYLLDVRTEVEFNLGHIEGAVNIPVDDLRNQLDKITVSKETPIYVNCQVGLRAYIGVRILQENGFKNVYNLSGGYKTYSTATRVHKLNNQKPHVDKDIDTQNLENQKNNQIDVNTINPKLSIDACGLQCPGPIMQTYKAMEQVNAGDVIRIQSTDSGYARDIEKWCEKTGNTLIKVDKENKTYQAYIQKGCSTCATPQSQTSNENTTIVLFSGEMDKAMASMIIAQGSAAMGKNVTVFCTFWGLNLLRKDQKIKLKKPFIEKMFSKMMPRGPKAMGISKMNFGGLGAKMMKRVMRKKNVDSLEDLIKSAQEAGVNFIACNMSMDVMGIRKEELIDGIDYAGVATYLAESDTAGVTLFI
ncbi:CoA-disulfide reductase [Mycoplasmatota bacterium]|nr:CoA-disulfide reductase [Mycoplasmatota bacterium]